MKLFPAIDILEGRAVRLLYGKRERVTDYGDPLDRAKAFLDSGAQALHVVDLSGAFGETSRFNALLEKIAALGAVVQSGGGLRSYAAMRERLEAGASRIVLGTVCVQDPALFERAVHDFGAKIVAGIDAKDGFLAVQGWTQVTDTDAVSFGKRAYESGVRETVFTDVGRDGALAGVNVEASAAMQRQTKLNVIASGGVRDIEDLYRLNENGVYGAILGRAVYTGALDLKRACEELQ